MWPPVSSALSVRGLRVRLGGTVILDDASLEVKPGHMVALLGPSGCGKTTLLRTVAGLERAEAGTIEAGGVVLEGPGRHLPPHRRNVGLVFQDYALFPHMTVAGNIGYGVKGADARARVAALLQMAGLSGLENRYPHELSGGQQQRVAVLRAVAPSPAVLLLDEPFSNLDPGIRARLRGDVVRDLRATGVTAVFVTHDRSEAFAIADEVALMERGRILQSGPPAAVYYRPASMAAAAIAGDVQYLPATVRGRCVETALGRFELAGEAADGLGFALVRPEWLLPEADPDGPATVTHAALLGAHWEYELEVTGAGRMRMTAAAARPFAVGDRLALRVAVPLPVFSPADRAESAAPATLSV